MAAKFIIYLDKSKKYHFRFQTSRGETIIVSEAYQTKGACVNKIKSIQKNAPASPIVDETIKKESGKKSSEKKPSAKQTVSTQVKSPVAKGSSLSKTIQDKVFGIIEYDGFWSKNMKINFFKKPTEVCLIISGDETGKFTDGQYAAYTTLIKDWDKIQSKLLDAVLEYYKKERYEIGCDIEDDELYPQIETADQLLEYITLVGIFVRHSLKDREIGITFDCTWDDENGVGLKLKNEEVVRSGYQDTAM